jgi:DNA-directed RNA polymerase specialized sigma24 family protein
MSSSESVTRWIRELQAGDHEAAGPLYERYFNRLIRLAQSRLHDLPQRATSAEDVAAHAFASFCRRLERGDFTRLHDRDDLWRLLARIIIHKALKVKRNHFAARRGGGDVQGESGFVGPEGTAEGSSGARGGIDQQPGDDLPPDLLAEAGEEFQRRLDSLGNETLRSVALWKLEGYSNEEIAELLGVVPRTVERKLRAIRSLWRPEEVDR